jgi:hypothetical protein
MRRSPLLLGLAAVGAITVLVALATLVFRQLQPPPLSQEAVRSALFATIDRESPEAFLVTGALDLTATTRVENSKVFLPNIVGLDLGTARATVRVPGRVSYGFPVDSLRPEMIRLREDGVVEVEMPALAVYSVEPDLAAMEVETERGWARAGGTEEAVERRAMAIVEGAMRRQALSHLGSSYQPRINTARAMERLLSPALQGLGMEAPRFDFRLGDGLVVRPTD